MADNTPRVPVRPDDPIAHIDTVVIDRLVVPLTGGAILRDYWRLGTPATILVTQARGWVLPNLAIVTEACNAVALDADTSLLYAPEFLVDLIEHVINDGEDPGPTRRPTFGSLVGELDFEPVAAALVALHRAERAASLVFPWQEEWLIDAACRLADICAESGCSPEHLVELAPQGLLRMWNLERLEPLRDIARTAFERIAVPA